MPAREGPHKILPARYKRKSAAEERDFLINDVVKDPEFDAKELEPNRTGVPAVNKELWAKAIKKIPAGIGIPGRHAPMNASEVTPTGASNEIQDIRYDLNK